MAELLTQHEHDMITKIASLMGDYKTMITDSGRALHPGDLDEWARLVHAMQDRVLAQAAARAYPDRYRLAGIQT